MKKIALLLIGLTFVTVKNQSQTVTDYDGNVYDTVMIGTQSWLKQNLRTTHYNNGVAIPDVTSNSAWASVSTGARCYYDNDSVANDSLYGPLYNWFAVSSNNNLCPAGWHIPTNLEWETTETSLGGAMIAGGKMKESGTLHWLSPNTGASNSTDFTGLPGGMRDPVNNNFRNFGENGLWWTSTAIGTNAYSTYMWNQFAGIDHNLTPKRYGFSVRCIKDITTGTGEYNDSGTLKVFPNPAKNMFYAEINAQQDLRLLVYDVYGKLILQTNLASGRNGISLSDFPKGIYFLKAVGEDFTVLKKFIKE